jgi:hypothetical protein
MGVRREKAALFQSVQVPTRRRLQPEATGAAMEVTKLHGVHLRYGLHTRAATVFRDTLSEGFSYASKRSMRRPTRQPFRGRLIRLGE